MKYIALILATGVAISEGFTPASAALIAFLIWSIPLNYLRTKFRKIVYQTNDWRIALKPVFVAEIKALLGITKPTTICYSKTRNIYRLYLIIFLALYLVWMYLR